MTPLLVRSLTLVFFLSMDLAQGESFFSDPRFEKGFVLSAATIVDRPIEIGHLPPLLGEEKGRWRIAQWGTRHLLTPGEWRVEGDRHVVENEAKSITVTRSDEGAPVLGLGLWGLQEFGDHLRALGESWPHLLIEERFATPVKLDSDASVDFGIRFRVLKATASLPEGKELDPSLHTAQVTAFWTLANRNEESPDFGEQMWFGIPLFDVRHEIPAGHQALDGGQEHATGKFIYVPDGNRFWKGNTGDGNWHEAMISLAPYLEEGIAVASSHGYMKNTKLSDCVLTSFNMGWEVTGPYDALIEITDLYFGPGAKGDQDVLPKG